MAYRKVGAERQARILKRRNPGVYRNAYIISKIPLVEGPVDE